MKKSKISEAQIVAAIKEHEAGKAAVDICCREEENRRLKHMYAELALDNKIHPTEGQDLYYSRIRKEGLRWNYQWVRRVYLMLGMNRRRKVCKRIPERVKQPLLQPEGPCETWSLDFMSDVLINNRKFRTFNVIDDYNREAIAVEVALSMPATTVTKLLERITKEQGKPKRVRTDNGPEFISKEFRNWSAEKGIQIQYIQPGRPMQNGYIERFNRSVSRANSQ